MYKRQGNFGSCMTDENRTSFYYSSVKAKAAYITDKTGPVSYTHLDVYKRQPLTNVGKMDGAEVVQVYVKSLTNPDAPIKSLKGLSLIHILNASDKRGLMKKCSTLIGLLLSALYLLIISFVFD